jgi:SAM-dependent methyltransferase
VSQQLPLVPMQDLRTLYDDRYRASYMDHFRGDELVRRQLLERLFCRIPLSTGTVLDTGCGQGRYLEVLRHYYPNCRLAGCDISTVAIEKARLRAPSAELRVMETDRFPFSDASFDLALSVEVFEHVNDLRLYVSEIARVLKPGGHLIFSTPCANPLSFEWFLSHLRPGGVQRTSDGYRRWSLDDPAHLRRLTSSEATRVLQAAAMNRLTIRCWYHFFGPLSLPVGDWRPQDFPVLRERGFRRKLTNLARHVYHFLADFNFSLVLKEGLWFGCLPTGSGMIGLFQKRS